MKRPLHDVSDAVMNARAGREYQEGDRKKNRMAIVYDAVSVSTEDPVAPPLCTLPCDCATDVLWLRLGIREFVLRCEDSTYVSYIVGQQLDVPLKVILLFNDPLCAFPKHAFRECVASVLRHPSHLDHVPRARVVKLRVSLANALEEEWWRLLFRFLRDMFYIPRMQHTEKSRLLVFQAFVDALLWTKSFARMLRMDAEDLEVVEKRHFSKLQTVYGDHMREMEIHTSKKATCSRLDTWVKRYDRMAKACHTRIKTMRRQAYRSRRDLSQETRHLGTDRRGNTYWIFQTRALTRNACKDFGSQISIVLSPACKKELDLPPEADKAEMVQVPFKHTLALAEWIAGDSHSRNLVLQYIKDPPIRLLTPRDEMKHTKFLAEIDSTAPLLMQIFDFAMYGP